MTNNQITIERLQTNGCGEAFKIRQGQRTLGVVHSELVATTLRDAIERGRAGATEGIGVGRWDEPEGTIQIL